MVLRCFRVCALSIDDLDCRSLCFINEPIFKALDCL